MEPAWLGVTGIALGSSARSIAEQVTKPFKAVLDAAHRDSHDKGPENADQTKLDPLQNPHLQLIAELLTGKPQVGDEVELDFGDIRYRADSLQQDLELRIAEALQAAGVDLGEEVRLRFSPVDGRLEIVGDSPERGAIESVLSADESIAADLRQLAAMRSLISAAEQSSEFADAYETDPFEAAEGFATLFESNEGIYLTGSSLLVELRFE